LASEAVLLRRSGKIRSTELFSFQGAVKSDLGVFIVHPFRCAGAAGRVKTEKEPHDGEV
jgi:hypothetical protein